MTRNTDQESPRSARRRFGRVTMRGLMVLILLASCALGWWLHRERTRARALATLRSRGYRVKLADAIGGRWVDRIRDRAASSLGLTLAPRVEWVSFDRTDLKPDLAGAIDAFVDLGDVPRALIDSTGMTNEDLAKLATARRLESLEFSFIAKNMPSFEPIPLMRDLTTLSVGRLPITDKECEWISTLDSLESFHAFEPRASDVGAARLGRLKNLKLIMFKSKDLTDSGFRAMLGSPKLEIVAIDGARVTSLAPLAGRNRLVRISARYTKVDDAGLAPIADLHGLEALDLSGTPVTDKGVAALVGLKKLEELDLDGCRGITDAAVPSLLQLPSLARLDLSETGLTDAGLSRLTSARRFQWIGLRRSRVTPEGAMDAEASGTRVFHK